MTKKSDVKKSNSSSLTVPLSKKAHKNLCDLQAQFNKQTGGFISLKSLGTQIFETVKELPSKSN